MRFLLWMLLMIPFFGFSQSDSVLEYSPLEIMIMQPGNFLKIDTDIVGYSDKIAIGSLTAIDLNNTANKQQSVCFVVASIFSSPVFTPGNLQIDMEELSTLVNVLTKMKEVIESKKPGEWQSYQYVFSNLTVLSMENRLGNKGNWDISFYKRYKYLNAKVPGSELYFRGKHIGELLDVLSRYRDSLKKNSY